jgi:hypothetical protein
MPRQAASTKKNKRSHSQIEPSRELEERAAPPFLTRIFDRIRTMAQSSNKKHYYVGRSDEGYVVMSEDRLEKLLDLMPMLRNLLFGHSQMKAKELKHSAVDGAPVLEIPSLLPVTLKSFLFLTSCVLEESPLPHRPSRSSPPSRLEELLETMNILGGCDALTLRLQDVSNNLSTPEEDTEDLFVWHLHSCSRFAYLPDMKVSSILAQGFFYRSSDPQGASGPQVYHYYRKRK